MSKRTRISSRIDSQRVAQLVATPGIDPRIWVSLCIVDKVVVDTSDDGAGVFADVHIMSTATLDDDGNPVAQKETVRVAADYAGNGFGFFFPPLEGDEVICEWPDGNPDHGGILTRRLWSASDPPPQVAADNPNDALLMINKDCNLRIVAQGQGNIILQIDQGNVLLGDEKTTKTVCIDKDQSDAGMLYFTPNVPPAGAAVLAYTPPPGPYPPAVAPVIGIPLSAIITAGAVNVKARSE